MAFVRRSARPSEIAPAPPPTDRDGALLDLDDPSASVRRRAARRLGQLPEAATALCRRLAVEPNPAVQETILTSLIAIDSAEAVEGLIPLLRREETGLRNDVIEALLQMPDRAAPHVPQLLFDEDPDIRLVAVDLFRVVKPRDATALLRRLIETEPEVNVCAAAVDRLADIDTPDVIPALDALSQRFCDEPFMQFVTAAAILRITGGRPR